MRTHRDSLQKNFDTLNAKDISHLKFLGEMKVLASARQERIVCLESELARLKVCMAADAGEKGLIEFFNHTPAGNPYASLIDDARTSKIEVETLRETVKTLEGGNELGVRGFANLGHRGFNRRKDQV